MRSTRQSVVQLSVGMAVLLAFLAALPAAAVASPAVITGSGDGTATATSSNPDAGKNVAFQGVFRGSPVTVGTYQGRIQLPGFIRNGRETGNMNIVGRQGSLALQLVGSQPVPGPDLVAGTHEFVWVITGATGAYQGLQGSGTVTFTFVPVPTPSPNPMVEQYYQHVQFGPQDCTTITQADSGKTFTLHGDSCAVLQLTNSLNWTEPQVSGTAVQLVPVTFAQDPGYREWDIARVAPGEATITSTGSPICTPGQVCPAFVVLFQVHIVVTN